MQDSLGAARPAGRGRELDDLRDNGCAGEERSRTMTQRSHRLAVTSLAILTAVTLAACGGSSQTADPQPSPAQPAPTAPPVAATSKPTPTQPASRPAPSPTTATRRSDFGFIRRWYAKTGTIYLRFDRAVL